MPLWSTGVRSGTRSGQPTLNAKQTGTLYFVTDEDVLERWDGDSWEQVAINAVASLDGIGDVNAASPSNGDLLTWDSTPGEWVPAAAPAGVTHSVLGTTSTGGSFSNSSIAVYKKVTVPSDGFILSIGAACKGNGSNVGSLGVGLYANNSGAPGALLVAGPLAPYNGTVDIYKSTTVAWVHRPLGAWVTAGDYWLMVQSMYNGGAMQLAYDSTGPDYSATASNGWFTDPAGASAASCTYSIRADFIGV